MNDPTRQDVTAVLSHDHDEVKELFQQIKEAADAPSRRDATDQVIAELVRHSVAEEEYLYPAAREFLPNGDALVDKEIEDHAEVEKMLKKLESLDADDPDFMRVFEQMSSNVLEHIEEEEEDELFPELREHATQEQLLDLGDKVTRAKKLAPTRPHPSAPDTPPLNKILAPGAGLVDRLRDKLAGRNT
jgi:hemerythrin superfamily protein